MLFEAYSLFATPTPTPTLSKAPADCRVYERKSCELPTTCQPASLLAMKEPGWSATIRDISQGGIRVDVSRRFEKGTPLAIELPGNPGCEASVVFAKVIHIRRLEDGNWALGCKFVCELSEDEVQRLLTLDLPPRPRAKFAPAQRPGSAPTIAITPVKTVLPEVPTLVEKMVLTNVQFKIAIQRECQLTWNFKRFQATKCWPLAPGKIVRINVRGNKQANCSLKIELVESRQVADTWHFQAKLVRPQVATDWLRALGSCS